MKRTIYHILSAAFLLMLVVTQSAMAQQCGPGCPACSGKSLGELLGPNTIMGSVLFVPDGEEETAVYNLRYGVFTWLDVGIGYAQDQEEVIWSVRVQPMKQDPEGWRPALILGVGSVQTGGADQSAYIQLTKKFELVEHKFSIGLSGGYATDMPDFDEDWGLGTLSLTFYDKLSPFYTYDGINSHLGLTWFATDWLNLTGFYLEMENPAVSAAVQWTFGGKP